MSKNNPNIIDIHKGILKGKRQSVARGITIIENNLEGKEELIANLFPEIGKAQRIGIAGPPGVGKSTITLHLAKAFRALDKTVGIVAVDPTSPFSGGALLGDRIRMTEIFNDPGVFIRSMATRGSLGGLTASATEAGDLLDASGKNIVIFETVGIGQSELDIAEACDTVLIVLAPESGDGVQALKAGFMEIADIFVVNKADREGAERTVIEINTVISLKEKPHGDNEVWNIPVLKTIATKNSGIDELLEQAEAHFGFLQRNNLLEIHRKDKLHNRVKSIIRKMLRDQFWTDKRRKQLEDIIENSDTLHSPYSIARKLTEDYEAE